MALKGRLQIGVCRFFDHHGENLRDLLLLIEDVLQTVQEKVVKCLDLFREYPHGNSF